MFEAVATATTYGTGASLRRRVMCTTSGVITRQTMSLTRNADSSPLEKITVGRR